MIKPFADLRGQLFGREAIIEELVDRASRPGLTALVARPLMGKTWTLTEVARQLQESGRHLVGYHESKGGETSHLLYSVANLYARWLSEASLQEQARLFWKQHEDDWVVQVGAAVGALFGKLGKAFVPEGVADLVRDAFDSLSNAQKELSTGGLQLPRLPHDLALSLTRLVEQVSGRGVVLMLDAWEQSPAMQFETLFLQTFLRHLEEWPPTHLFVAVRHPDAVAGAGEDAHRALSELCDIYPAARCVELAPMDLTGPSERERVVTFVQERVDAAREFSAEDLLGLIDGYPGVIYRWRNLASTRAAPGGAGLRLQADNAQAGRYPELGLLLGQLTDAQLAFAARIASFPRLDAERWESYREILLNDEQSFYALVDSGVLADEPFPSYGHDTRHRAARRWFTKKERIPLFRRTSEHCIDALAARITGVNTRSRPYFEALIAFGEVVPPLGVNDSFLCLLAAARVAFADLEGAFRPRFDDFCGLAIRRNARFVPLVAQALYNRGITRNTQGDANGAIADQTAVINLPGAPVDLVAKALLYRGFLRNAAGDIEAAIADLAVLVELPHAPVSHVALALYNRAVIKLETGDFDSAMADYTAVIQLPDAPVAEVAKALSERGFARGQRGDVEHEMADYSAVIALHHAPAKQVAQSLHNRARQRAVLGDFEGAMADYAAVIELPHAPVDTLASALNNRGLLSTRHGDLEAAITDYTAVTTLADAPTDELARALNNRAVAKGDRDDIDGALADYTAVIALPNVPAYELSRALNNRGTSRRQRQDIDGALADYAAVIALPNAPPHMVATALANRAAARGKHGDRDGAIADYTAIVALPDASADEVAGALLNRAAAKQLGNDINGALADYTAIIDLAGASANLVARALQDRSAIRARRNDFDGALVDVTAVIDLPDAPAEQMAWALNTRGSEKSKDNDMEGALADFTRVIQLPGAPGDEVAWARLNRAINRGKGGDLEGAIADCNAVIEFPKVSGELVAQALFNRGVAKAERGDLDGARVDFAAAADYPDSPAEVRAAAAESLKW